MKFQMVTMCLGYAFLLVSCNGVDFQKLNDADFSKAEVGSQDETEGGSPSLGIPVGGENLREVVRSYKLNASGKVDILFVVDNSPSMKYEQDSMAYRARNFINILSGVDYQLAVTTTEAYDSKFGDGTLLSIDNRPDQKIITASTTPEEAQYLLGRTLQRGSMDSNPSPLEQGIYATYRVVERALSGQAFNKSFMRADAHFAVVLISDEDESRTTSKNSPENLIALINKSYSGNKTLTFHSIITRPGDENCKSTYGDTYGVTYSKLSKLTGGIVGDVCAADYASQVEAIAQGVRSTLRSMALECSPKGGVKVMRNGVEYKAARSVKGLSLLFDDLLPSGDYAVNYQCQK